MQIKTETQTLLQQLSILPKFAGYLLAHRTTEFSLELIKWSKKVNLPLLNLLAQLSHEELLGLTMKSSVEFLQALSTNNAQQHIDNAVQRFKGNQMPNIENDKVVAEDITLTVFIRKQAFLHFLPEYCTTVEQVMELVKELDIYMLASETALTNAHAGLLQKRIEERNLFIETINATLPGAVYIFDLKEFKNIYATEKLADVFGYSYNELNEMGVYAMDQLIHEEDKEEVTKQVEEMKDVADGVIKSYKYRIKLKNGAYRWIRNYETVFKRNADGSVCQTIAIALDVDKEKRLSDDLKKREKELLEAQKLYKQAQAISHLGHFSMELKTGELIFTEEAARIYGLDTGKSKFNYQEIISLRHPDDYERTQSTIQHTIKTYEPFDFHFRIITKNGAEKTIHTLGEITFNEAGNATHLVGTIQDVTEKHKLLKQLQDSEKLYKQAQAMAHLGNWTTDLITQQFTWSDEMYRIYEISPQDHINFEQWFAFIHPDDKETVLNYWEECKKNKQPYDKHHRIITRNGTIKMLHRKGEWEWDANGTPIKLAGTTQDVTEQYTVQQELKENQTFIRKITDATPSIIASYNVHTGKYVFISEGLQKLLGYGTAEVMEKGLPFFMDIVHPDDLNLLTEKNATFLKDAAQNVSNNDLILEFTYRMRHKNGAYQWFHTYGTIFDRNANGNVEHILNITLDVSAQIGAEAKIAEQELFIQQLADASPTILYLFDIAENSIVYINKEIFFVLGYTTEEVAKMGNHVVHRLYHPDDYHLLPERRESAKRFQHRDSMIQYECRVKSKEDEWKWLLVREVIFKTDDGEKPLQILGAALDITKRKEMERSLLQNSFQLEQSNASLEEFAYVASHDLKEPLRKISTFGDRLITTQAANMTSEGKVYLKKIVDASQRMQTMVNDLLSISLISGDRSFQMHSLQAVLEDAVQTLEYKIENKSALIDADVLPEASIVPSQFRQLFQNLLSNSLKFTPDDRQPVIKITAEFLTPEEVVEFQIPQAPQYLKLQFKDNGIGFEEEYAGKIFQIFQRLHGRSEYEGTGIGLAICKKIVEHHSGLIFASGKPNAGATFTIILPA